MREREINEKISAWIGRPCTCSEIDEQYGSRYWGDCSMHSMGGLPTPYATSDRRAVELISVLSDRGYKTILESYPDGNIAYGFQISRGTHRYSALQPTISAAITSALIGMLDRETERLR